MAQTARITFLTEPRFKKRLEAQAKELGVSVSELIRLRCDTPLCAEEKELVDLADKLKRAVIRANATMDKSLKDTEAFLRESRENRKRKNK